MNRVLLLEPSTFEKYPISEKCVEFALQIAKENIPEIQIFVGEFSEFKALGHGEIEFKEHPLNRHFEGRRILEIGFVRSMGSTNPFSHIGRHLRKMCFEKGRNKYSLAQT